MADEIKSIWIGPEYVSIGTIKVEDKMVHFKKFGAIPGLDKMRPIIPFNEKTQLWSMRKLFDPQRGVKDDVRIYWCDIHDNPYFAKLNPVEHAKLEHAKQYIAYLLNMVERVNKLVKDSKDDMLKRRVKDEFKFYTEELKSFNFAPTGNK